MAVTIGVALAIIGGMVKITVSWLYPLTQNIGGWGWVLFVCLAPVCLVVLVLLGACLVAIL